MRNLLRADLYRALKNKLLRIGLIITAALAIFQALVYKFIAIISDIGEEEIDMFGQVLNGNGIALWNNGASIGGNTAAFIVPIFVTIFILREFGDRTVRNKLIMGYTRSQIYFSSILLHLFLMFVYLFVASFFGLVFGTIFFAVGGEITFEFIAMIFVSFVLQFILSYTVLCLGIVLSINVQSPVIGIIIPIALSFVASLINTIALLGVSGSFINFWSCFSFYQSSEISLMTNITELVKQTFATDVITFENIAIFGNPLLRILITAPVVITTEIMVGYVKFKYINFK